MGPELFDDLDKALIAVALIIAGVGFGVGFVLAAVLL